VVVYDVMQWIEACVIFMGVAVTNLDQDLVLGPVSTTRMSPLGLGLKVSISYGTERQTSWSRAQGLNLRLGDSDLLITGRICAVRALQAIRRKIGDRRERL